MSPTPATCDTCRTAIPDSDFETGAAISVLGKTYCGVCKNRAIKDISLDDLVADASPQPGAVPRAVPRKTSGSSDTSPTKPAIPPVQSSGPTMKLEELPTLVAPSKKPPAAPPPPAPAQEKSPVSRRRVVVRSSSSGPLWILAGLGAAAAVLVVVLLAVGGDKGKKGGGGGSTPPPDPGPVATPPKPKDPAEAREEDAVRAYTQANLVASRLESSFEEIFAAIDKARTPCQGTKMEAKLEELRNRKLKEKEALEAQKQIGKLVDDLKEAVASDKDFKRFAELLPRFQTARELASKVSSARQAEVQQIQVDYTTRYEKAAEPYFNDLHEAAAQLADEKRFDDALKFIDSFPVHLRQSGVWKTLERLRADIERRKRASK